MKGNNKKPIGKIVLAIFLAVVIGIGVYGTIIGIKSAVKDKKYKDSINNTTTEEIKLSKKEKVFSCDNFRISLTEDFEVFEDSAVEVGCTAEGIEVYVFGDTFEAESKESLMSGMEYIKSLAEGSEGNTKISEHNGVPFAEYIYQGENDETVKNYKVFCYKGENCFWMVHFITERDYVSVYKPYIFEWIKTIEAK